MTITKTENDGFHSIEISDGMVQVGWMGHTEYDITIGGVGENKKEAIEDLKRNIRRLEANIIPEIKEKIND